MLKGFIKFVFRFWYLTLWSAICIGCYISVFIPPNIFWPAVFTSYAIPGVMMLNLILLLFLPLLHRKLAVFPLINLFFGLPFVFITISYGGERPAKDYDLSILSFNTKFFRKAKVYDEYSLEMIKWATDDTSAVKCIQEYCTNTNIPEVDVTRIMKKNGYNSFVYSLKNKESDNYSGMAIFSKYEILDSGFVWKELYNHNSILFADLKINDDTLRIYNVHLFSMGLFNDHPKQFYQYESARNLASKLKFGALQRSQQIYKLLSHTQSCPYPYLICGDFNDTPYSYNYFKLKRNFANAFEEAGNGFGFSLNSILFFLRIDHHFYGPGIEAVQFRVDRSMKISDHFPTRGYYRIE